MKQTDAFLNRTMRVILFVVFDLVALLISFTIAVLALEAIKLSNQLIDNIKVYIIFSISFKIVWFYFFGLYKIVIKHISFEDIVRVFLAVFSANFFVYIALMFSEPKVVSTAVIIVATPIEFLLILAPRLFEKLYSYVKIFIKTKRLDNVNTIIIGAGAAGKIALNELRQNRALFNKVIGFIDDDLNKVGKRISGVPILGTLEEIKSIITVYNIKEAVFAIRDIDTSKYQVLVDCLTSHNVDLRKLNLISDIDAGAKAKIIDIKIEDLLERKAIELENNGVEQFIKNEIILITGGGGSIGSELTRQIAKYQPQTIIIFDIYENNAYEIQMELERQLSKKVLKHFELHTIIGSVYNQDRVYEVFETYRPTIVFHAAACKHVPLMENSAKEAIRTNVIGTNYVAEAASHYGVKKFVLVSSDKAVRPTNVMGATKRFAELILAKENSKNKTKFSAVRFGNVLGSNGSVIPLFTKQIADGGPITVTDENITRFFMTIKEAVSLILQSAVYADGGEIFVLDMGEPVKIIDLAKKMIRLKNLVLDKDIKIEITGLRPGEKLYEELLIDPKNNVHLETKHPKIFIEKQVDDHRDLKLAFIIDNFEKISNDEVKLMLSSIIETYKVGK